MKKTCEECQYCIKTEFFSREGQEAPSLGYRIECHALPPKVLHIHQSEWATVRPIVLQTDAACTMWKSKRSDTSVVMDL